MQFASQCILCKHRHADVPPEAGMRCDAFPEGIPSEIVRNEVDHRQPVRGDRGVRWEPELPGDEHPGVLEPPEEALTWDPGESGVEA
jgi:hypothetical protein